MDINRNTHRDAFEEYASNIIDLDSVERVLLFGSVARGSHGVNSDVDVLIEVADKSEADEIEDRAFKTSSEFGVPITPIIVEEDRREGQFMETVENEGVEYVRS